MKKTIFAVFLLVLAGTAAYSNSLDAEFQFDDLKQISENYHLGDLLSPSKLLQEIHPRFLTYLTFAANYEMHRLDVRGYHVVNLLIHLGSGILVFFLVLLLCDTPRMKVDAPPLTSLTLAIFSALIFLLHPVQTQAVTYIVQRLASFAGLFYLAAVTFYVHARSKRNRVSYRISLLLTFLAMFTKQTAFTLPITILLTEYIFFQAKREGDGSRFHYVLPFLGALLVLPAYYLLQALTDPGKAGMLARETQTIGRGDYLLTQFHVIRTYLRLLFLPVAQNLDYDYPIYRNFFNDGTWLAFTTLLVVFVTGLWLLHKHRLMGFAILWFFLTLSVESSVIPIRDVIFEHRLYVPLFGFALIVPQLLALLFKRERIVQGILIIVVFVFGVATYQRNNVWRDGVRLWQDVVLKSPLKARPYENLAYHYNQRGHYEDAITNAQKSLELDPYKASAYTTLGVAYGALGKIDQEIEYTLKALELDPAKTAKEFNNIGSAYGKKKDYQKAILYFKKGIERDPQYPANYLNLGFALIQIRQLDAAILNLQRAVEIDPGYAEAYNYMGIAYGHKGQFQETLKYAQKAIALNEKDPDAYNTLGVAYQNLGDKENAMNAYQKALELDPAYKRARVNLSHLSRS